MPSGRIASRRTNSRCSRICTWCATLLRHLSRISFCSGMEIRDSLLCPWHMRTYLLIFWSWCLCWWPSALNFSNGKCSPLWSNSKRTSKTRSCSCSVSRTRSWSANWKKDRYFSHSSVLLQRLLSSYILYSSPTAIMAKEKLYSRAVPEIHYESANSSWQTSVSTSQPSASI